MLFLLASPVTAQAAPPVTMVRLRVTATEADRALLLERLNHNAKGRNLGFETGGDAYDYKIMFATEDDPRHWMTLNTASASAEVYDPGGVLLFSVRRENRASVGGAANAVAKEVIKRILRSRQK